MMRVRRSRFIDKSLFLIFALLGTAALLAMKAFDVSQLAVTLVPVCLILLYAAFTVMRWSR